MFVNLPSHYFSRMHVCCLFVYSRSSLDNSNGEKEKLKTDMVDANNRIGMLVKEGDERQTLFERNKEKELL